MRWGQRVVTVGGDAPVRVQSMTNTDTVQVIEDRDPGEGTGHRRFRDGPHHRQHAGSCRGRAAHPRPARPHGHRHFPWSATSTTTATACSGEHPACAEALSKYRINPGNVGKGDKHDRQFAQMVEIGAKLDKAVRIGVNWGSLDAELLTQMMDDNAKLPEPFEPQQIMYRALIASAVGSARRAEEIGLRGEQIILSCKMSGVQDLVSVYRRAREAL